MMSATTTTSATATVANNDTNDNNNTTTTTTTETTTYTFNPYSRLAAVRPVVKDTTTKEVNKAEEEAAAMRRLAAANLPEGTLRLDLYGKVQFFAFPEGATERLQLRTAAPPLDKRPENLAQMFFGQLPFRITDTMIVWLCEMLAESNVLYIERVLQEKSRKGCMQVFVDEEDAPFLEAALNKRVLFDATGVWQAQDEAQVAALERHTSQDANHHKGLPFRCMVVEKSTSTYVRRNVQQQPPQPSRKASPAPEGVARLPEYQEAAASTPPPYHAPSTYLPPMDEEGFEALPPAVVEAEEPTTAYAAAESQPQCSCPDCYSAPAPEADVYYCDECCEAQDYHHYSPAPPQYHGYNSSYGYYY